MAAILFGLGNPGPKYEKTRHNAGFQVLDQLALRHGTSFKKTRLFGGETADLRLGGEVVRLVKPSSFMNLVGPVYLRALDVYDADPKSSLVLVDDFQLPMGRLRFRAGGSSGSHNGLRSIEKVLATREYPRLKIGIGPAPEGARWADYVLRGYDSGQRKRLPELLDRAADACETFLRNGLEVAQNRFNSVSEDNPDA